jgi:hypothetical protein
MFCNYCRATNPTDAVYCSACGQTIGASEDREKQRENERIKTPSKTSEETVTQPTRTGLSAAELEKLTDTELDELWSAHSKIQVLPSQNLQEELRRRAVRRVETAATEPAPQPRRDPVPASSLDAIAAQIQSRAAGNAAAIQVAENSSSFINEPSILVYGTFGRRFTAYFADLILVYFVAIIAYVLSFAFHLPLSGSEGESQLVFWIALVAYMVVAQAAYHTTIGKYVHGLEVRSVKAGGKYPALWRILIRETIGRIGSSLFWGAGYWFAINKPKKQAWSDELAGTVVTTRPTNRVLARALTAFVLVALVFDVGTTGYGLNKEERDKRYAAFNIEVQTATKDVVATRDAVNQRVNDTKPVHDWADFRLWQDQMRALKTDLDRYEGQIDRIQGLIQRGVKEDVVSSQTERNEYLKLREVYDLRKDQAEKLRQEANLVVNCDGTPASMASLRNDLRLLDSDVDGLEHQASQRLAEIGVK